MDETNQKFTSQQNQTPQKPEEDKKPHTAWLVIGVIVVVVLVVLWMMSRSTYAPEPQDTAGEGVVIEEVEVIEGVVVDEDVAEVIPTAAKELQLIQTQGTTDDLSAIEADLNASDLNTLDQELLDIERELGGL
jgi:hypothetical protein